MSSFAIQPSPAVISSPFLPSDRLLAHVLVIVLVLVLVIVRVLVIVIADFGWPRLEPEGLTSTAACVVTA